MAIVRRASSVNVPDNAWLAFVLKMRICEVFSECTGLPASFFVVPNTRIPKP